MLYRNICFKATSNWLYVWNAEVTEAFLHSFPMCTNPLPDTGKGFCFCCEKHVSDLHI